MYSLPHKRLLSALLVSSLFAVNCGPSNNDTNKDTTPADMSSPDMMADLDTTPEDMAPEDMTPEDMLDPDMGEDMSADMTEEPQGYLIPELGQDVQVSFDAQGVPHIRCQTNDDCFAAQGYFHAAHRFAQMDLRRRVGSGRISELLRIDNDNAFQSDVTNRLLLSTRDGEPLEEVMYTNLGATEKAAIDAYARGVNAWLEDLRQKRNGAELSEEAGYALLNYTDIPEWRPQDSLLAGFVFLNSLMDIGTIELNAANALAIYDENLFLDLYLGWHLDPESSIITSAGGTYNQLGPASLTSNSRLNLSKIKQRLGQNSALFADAQKKIAPLAQFSQDETPFGSNSWATAPARNRQDHALLANDPHLSLSNPALWYLVEMDARTSGSGDLHAAGVSFPGMPGVLIGYSEDVAWSATVAFWDLVDIYVEELSADKQGVVRNGTTIPFIKKTYTFTRSSGDVEQELLFVPGHGPVISMGDDTAITLKSVLAESQDDFKLFLGLGNTHNLEEAREYLAGSTAAGFNFTLIDRAGNIAYYPFAGVPRREWDTGVAPTWLPLPGDGSAEWSDKLIKAGELPELYNPPNNFIATANAAITDDMLDGIPGNAGYPPLQTPFMAPGSRQTRIVELLRSTSEHTANGFMQMQGDTTSWVAQRLLPGILEKLNTDEMTTEQQALYDTLSTWNYTCPAALVDRRDPENSEVIAEQQAAASGCSAFHVLLFTLTYQVFRDNVAEQGGQANPSYELRAIFWLLTNPSMLHGEEENYWDDRSTEDTVEDATLTTTIAFETTLTHLDSLFGSTAPEDWIWGRIHTLTNSADLFSALTPLYNNGPFATDGGLYTVNVANPGNPGEGDGSYTHGAGASMRMVVEGKPEGFVGHFNFPGGQIHRRTSEHYDDLIDGWLDNSRFVMPFTQEEVDAAATETLTISPK